MNVKQQTVSKFSVESGRVHHIEEISSEPFFHRPRETVHPYKSQLQMPQTSVHVSAYTRGRLSAHLDTRAQLTRSPESEQLNLFNK